MQTKRTLPLIVFLFAAICATVLLFRLVGLSFTPMSTMEILAVAVPPLVLLASLPILLRPLFVGPRKQQSPSINPTDRALLIAGMVVGNALIFIAPFGNRWWWLMIVGGLIFPLISMLRASKPEKGMQRGQFSLRRLFIMVTVCAVFIGMMLAIERWYENAQAQNNERWLQRTRETNEEWLQTSRAIWENAREKLPAGVYEQKMKELDDEAAKKSKALDEEATKRGLK